MCTHIKILLLVVVLIASTDVKAQEKKKLFSIGSDMGEDDYSQLCKSHSK